MIGNHPNCGHEIYFIARGQHLNAIKRNGLILKQENLPSIMCNPTLATENIKELPKIDLFLICVKSYDLDEVIINITPYVKKGTLILPLLNGVNNYERIRSFLKEGIIFPACVYVGTHIEAPGIISKMGGEGKIILGPDPQHPDIKPENVFILFKLFQILYEWQEIPYIAIWSKFIFISAYGLVCAAASKTIGQVYDNSNLKDNVAHIMREIKSIANAKHIILPDSIVQDSLNKALHFPYDAKTSFQRDVESKGLKNEGDIFGKAVIDLGRQFNVPTPVTELYYTQLAS